MQTQNKLDRDYNALALFRYTIPSILSLLFMSLYQMVDAIFVSQFVSEKLLASINIVYPVTVWYWRHADAFYRRQRHCSQKVGRR